MSLMNISRDAGLADSNQIGTGKTHENEAQDETLNVDEEVHVQTTVRIRESSTSV